MRQNFSLAQIDVIKNIRSALLTSSTLCTEFKEMIPDADKCAQELWTYFVKRICDLHGTDLAGQLMDNIASTKRKAAALVQSKRLAPSSRTLQVKFEQLRAAKKKKKLDSLLVQDLKDIVPEGPALQDMHDLADPVQEVVLKHQIEIN